LARNPDGPNIILHGGRITTVARSGAEVQALAIRNGLVQAIGSDREITALAGADTKVVDLERRRVIPGLNDSHLHVTRGARFYNLELRWDGVRSLERALAMVAEQARRTPAGQWVRVVGGWSPEQFSERRMPTVDELNAAAPNTPVLVLFLYSQGFLNRAGVEALGITHRTPPPAPGTRYELLENGGAVLRAEPSPIILYRTVDTLPQLGPEDQVNSALQFFRELNRLGLTSAIDAGGGGHLYPRDYAATAALAADGRLDLRVSNYLFAQRAGEELAAYGSWTRSERLRLNRATELLEGYVTDGAGENLVASAGDFENFLAPRPELPARMEGDLREVVMLLARAGWPIRIHATYDQSISRMLDVFEPVFRETGYKARWAIDHAETISDRNIARVRRLGGGVAVQNRMAFAGEAFVSRYGPEAAASAPPLRKLMNAGLPLGAGTDGTRVSSYDPWASLAWMTTGRTVGGTVLYPPENRLTRQEALQLYTEGSAWFSGDERVKGRLLPGQIADLAVLSEDYFTVPEERIPTLSSVLTIVGGRAVHGSRSFASLAQAPPPVRPSWAPPAAFPGVAICRHASR
jgi:hypothetical protein